MTSNLSNDHLYKEYPTKTVLSQYTNFEGTMKFKQSLRIDGEYSGIIDANGLLVLGPNAKLKGDIICDEIIIGGEVRGNVTARKRLELLSTAKLYGDIKTAKLKIADGVIFQGKCEMTQS